MPLAVEALCMKRYLIDGNNVVCAWKGVVKPDQAQENEFLVLVNSFLGGKDEAVIVFDGPVRSGFRAPSINVRFSWGEKADAVLIRLIQDNPFPEQLVVVSDDRQVLQAAKGCRYLRSADFLGEAVSVKAEPEKPARLSPQEREKWLKAFGIEGS